MYDELIKRLREGAISADSGNEIRESLYRFAVIFLLFHNGYVLEKILEEMKK